VEKELEHLRKKLDQKPVFDSNSIKRDSNGSIKGSIKGMRETMNVTKSSFKEKLAFWSQMKSATN